MFRNQFLFMKTFVFVLLVLALISVSGCVVQDTAEQNVKLESGLYDGCLRLREIHNCDADQVKNIKIIGYKESENESGCITTTEPDCYTLEDLCIKKGLDALEKCAKFCDC